MQAGGSAAPGPGPPEAPPPASDAPARISWTKVLTPSDLNVQRSPGVYLGTALPALPTLPRKRRLPGDPALLEQLLAQANGSSGDTPVTIVHETPRPGGGAGLEAAQVLQCALTKRRAPRGNAEAMLKVRVRQPLKQSIAQSNQR